jgi:hypothetical protein
MTAGMIDENIMTNGIIGMTGMTGMTATTEVIDKR